MTGLTTPSPHFRALVMCLAVISFLAVSLSGWALYDRFTQTNAYRSDTKRVWHAVICQIEQAVAKSPMPPAKKQTALRFYDRLLTVDVQTTGCELIRQRKDTP